MKFLYIFITHQNNLNNCYKSISDMMNGEDFIVVNGGHCQDFYDSETNILNLNCNDKYIGLPEKVMKTFHYIISNENFNEYTHFVKLDDDMRIIKRFDDSNSDLNYAGFVHWSDGNRNWHRGRTGTFWDQIPYLGEFKPWCMGGFGYIVSRKSLKKIVPDHGYLNHIYEDVYLGILMNKVGILPININIKEYLISPDH